MRGDLPAREGKDAVIGAAGRAADPQDRSRLATADSNKVGADSAVSGGLDTFSEWCLLEGGRHWA